jgi:hypothetical protein
MNQDTAWKLLQTGGCIILAGAPEGTNIGIDMAQWQVQTSFCGFKMVPAGPHFITFSYVVPEV